MIRVAICDDDNQQLLHIKSHVDAFISESLTEYDIRVQTFENGADLIAEIDKGEHFDILLLDIIMPLVNGIQLAEEIRATNTVSKIIFLTSSPEFAIASYKVDAFYYILKPINKEDFFSVLEKACTDIYRDTEKHIIVKDGAGLMKIVLSKLLYAEVVDHSIYFHMRDGEIPKTLGKMHHLESNLLVESKFIKPHRSYIVNLDFIKKISPKGITITNGDNIPIARNSYKDIKKAYIDYSFEGGN